MAEELEMDPDVDPSDVLDETESIYEVEKIVGMKKVENNEIVYRVRWKGYNSGEDTWEPLENLLTCKDLVEDYIKAHKKGLGSSGSKRKTQKGQGVKADDEGGEDDPVAGSGHKRRVSRKPLALTSSSDDSTDREEDDKEGGSNGSSRSNDTFWQDLEKGNIPLDDGSDMYSKVKGRRAASAAKPPQKLQDYDFSQAKRKPPQRTRRVSASSSKRNSLFEAFESLENATKSSLAATASTTSAPPPQLEGSAMGKSSYTHSEEVFTVANLLEMAADTGAPGLTTPEVVIVDTPAAPSPKPSKTPAETEERAAAAPQPPIDTVAEPIRAVDDDQPDMIMEVVEEKEAVLEEPQVPKEQVPKESAATTMHPPKNRAAAVHPPKNRAAAAVHPPKNRAAAVHPPKNRAAALHPPKNRAVTGHAPKNRAATSHSLDSSENRAATLHGLDPPDNRAATSRVPDPPDSRAATSRVPDPPENRASRTGAEGMAAAAEREKEMAEPGERARGGELEREGDKVGEAAKADGNNFEANEEDRNGESDGREEDEVVVVAAAPKEKKKKRSQCKKMARIDAVFTLVECSTDLEKLVEDCSNVISCGCDLCSFPLPTSISNEMLKRAVIEGNTALVLKAVTGRTRLNLEQTDYTGMTLMMWACSGKHDDIVRLLIIYGALVNVRQVNGTTSLMIAAEQGYLGIVEMLVVGGAYLNMRSVTGETALMKAAKQGNQAMLRLLLDHGADLAILSTSDQTALSLARTAEGADLLQAHAKRLLTAVEGIANDYLGGAASLQRLVFPIRCFRIREAVSHVVTFKFDAPELLQQKGMGMLLFLVHAYFFGGQQRVETRLVGPCSVLEVILNSHHCRPLAEGSRFVYTLLPRPGENQLHVKTAFAPASECKLLVAGYALQLNRPPAEI